MIVKDELTEREIEVIKLIASGKTNKDIAAILKVTDTAIEKTIGTMLLKTNRSNRVSLVVYAINNNLINPEELDYD